MSGKSVARYFLGSLNISYIYNYAFHFQHYCLCFGVYRIWLVDNSRYIWNFQPNDNKCPLNLKWSMHIPYLSFLLCKILDFIFSIKNDITGWKLFLLFWSNPFFQNREYIMFKYYHQILITLIFIFFICRLASNLWPFTATLHHN